MRVAEWVASQTMELWAAGGRKGYQMLLLSPKRTAKAPAKASKKVQKKPERPMATEPLPFDLKSYGEDWLMSHPADLPRAECQLRRIPLPNPQARRATCVKLLLEWKHKPAKKPAKKTAKPTKKKPAKKRDISESLSRLAASFLAEPGDFEYTIRL